jgi:hypothetical protein
MVFHVQAAPLAGTLHNELVEDEAVLSKNHQQTG